MMKTVSGNVLFCEKCQKIVSVRDIRWDLAYAIKRHKWCDGKVVRKSISDVWEINNVKNVPPRKEIG